VKDAGVEGAGLDRRWSATACRRGTAGWGGGLPVGLAGWENWGIYFKGQRDKGLAAQYLQLVLHLSQL